MVVVPNERPSMRMTGAGNCTRIGFPMGRGYRVWMVVTTVQDDDAAAAEGVTSISIPTTCCCDRTNVGSSVLIVSCVVAVAVAVAAVTIW